MRMFFAATAASLYVSSATAAPMWIERQFIPTPELVAPAFAIHSEASDETVDHGKFASFLARYVRVGADGVARVAYGGVSTSDRESLRDYLEALQAVDPSALSHDEALAFWLNLYNAATVLAVIDAYPVDSIRDIDAVWSARRLTVSGVRLSLADIEHNIVRAAFPDPRAHYALNCASIGCPNLAPVPYAGERLDAQLDAAARDYVNHPRGVAIDGRKLVVSKIYGWYKDDFGGDEADIVAHLRQFAEPALSEALDGFDDIDGYAYDWSLNGAEPGR